MHQLELYYDCSSPWTYLAFESLQQLLAALPPDSVEVIYEPFLVGGVFNSVNPSVYENRAKPVPAKARYYQKDLKDWARFAGLQIGSPRVFPVNSVKAMRGAFYARDEGCLVDYSRKVFQAYWRDLQDISQSDVLDRIAADAGLPVEQFNLEITSDHRKSQLRANTDRLIERGGFGSPTFYIDGEDMYFGNDRMPLIARLLTES